MISSRRWCGTWFLLSAILLTSISRAADLLVEAQVEPFLSVRAVSNIARIGSVGTGGIDADLPFFIESNSHRVTVQLLVSHLYKDENPAMGVFLPVDGASGVAVQPLSARAVGGDLQLSYTSTENLSRSQGVFAALKTESLLLEVAPDKLFQEEVFFRVNWLREQQLMPAGIYRGYVVITVASP